MISQHGLIALEALELPSFVNIERPLPAHYRTYLERAPNSDRLVLRCIWLRSIGRNGELGWSRISHKMLTAATGLHKNSVYNAMRRLQQAGLISKAREPHWLVWYNGYRYWLH